MGGGDSCRSQNCRRTIISNNHSIACRWLICCDLTFREYLLIQSTILVLFDFPVSIIATYFLLVFLDITQVLLIYLRIFLFLKRNYYITPKKIVISIQPHTHRLKQIIFFISYNQQTKKTRMQKKWKTKYQILETEQILQKLKTYLSNLQKQNANIKLQKLKRKRNTKLLKLKGRWNTRFAETEQISL
jgi:hypothetical protein